MPENKSLVSLVQELTQIERELIQNEGTLSPESEQLFDLTQGDIKTKVDRYKHVMDAMDARSVYFKERADEMARARKLFESQKERLKSILKYAMTSLDTPELEGYDWRWRLSPLKDKLVIDATELPREYMKEEKIMVPNREAIEGDLLLGKTILGARFESSTMLRSYVNPVGKAKAVKEVGQ